MKFLPLKGEVDAVVGVLRDDTFEDETAMAKEIVRRLAQEIARRPSFALAVTGGSPFEFFWPFYYEADARKFSEQLGTLPAERRRVLLKMQSSVRDAEAKEKRDKEAAEIAKGLNWPKPGQTLTIRGKR